MKCGSLAILLAQVKSCELTHFISIIIYTCVFFPVMKAIIYNYLFKLIFVYIVSQDILFFFSVGMYVLYLYSLRKLAISMSVHFVKKSLWIVFIANYFIHQLLTIDYFCFR
jgi:hypothetical protein